MGLQIQEILTVIPIDLQKKSKTIERQQPEKKENEPKSAMYELVTLIVFTQKNERSGRSYKAQELRHSQKRWLTLVLEHVMFLLYFLILNVFSSWLISALSCLPSFSFLVYPSIFALFSISSLRWFLSIFRLSLRSFCCFGFLAIAPVCVLILFIAKQA